MRLIPMILVLPFIVLLPLTLGKAPMPTPSGAISISGQVEITREPGSWFHVEITNCGPIPVEIHHIACKSRSSRMVYDYAVNVVLHHDLYIEPGEMAAVSQWVPVVAEYWTFEVAQ